MSQTTQTLRLERIFDASPQQLWAAFVDPDQYAQWLNPAPGLGLVIHEFDVRPGGRIRFDMPQPDGSPNPQEGVFHALDPYRELVSGSPDKSFLLRARFEPLGKQTRLLIEVTGIPPEWQAPATVGWGQCFDKLGGHLERRRERPDSQSLRIERVFECTLDEMWAAWTDPVALAQWISPFPGIDARVDEFDVRVGGRVRFTMFGPNGAAFPEELGEFEVIDKPRQIVQYQPNVGRNDVFAGHPMRMGARFEPVGKDRTRVVLDVTGLPASFPVDQAQMGFGACLDKLGAAAKVPRHGFTLERMLPAPPEKVWEMWTTKAGIESWWGAGMGMKATVTEMDPRPGGRYAIRMQGKDLDGVNHGKFVALDRPRRLVMVWRFDLFLGPGETPYDVPITVELRPEGAGTRLVFTQGPLAKPDFTEGSREGVASNLASLAKALGA